MASIVQLQGQTPCLCSSRLIRIELLFNKFPVFHKFNSQLIFRRQVQLVTGCKYLVISFRKGKAHYGIALGIAKQDADGRVVAVIHHLAGVVVDVHLHLPQILMGKLADLQVNQHEAFEDVVVENKIDLVVVAVKGDPFLAGYEREPLP